MATSQNCCYLGRGKLYVRPYVCLDDETPVNPNSWEYIGNSEEFSVTPNTNEIEKKDYTSCVGGTDCSFTEIESVDVNIVSCCFNDANLARAFLGSGATAAVETIVGELHIATVVPGEDTYILANGNIDTAIPPVVTNATSGAVLVEGTDYVIGEGGEIIILAASTAVATGDEITLDYTTVESYCVQGLLESTNEVEIRFQGFNCENGEAFNTHVYRARLTASEQFDFINVDDFGRITFSGKLLKDPQIQGAGLSQYLKLTRAA